MENYTEIVSEINKAVADIKEASIKESTFKTLLEHALSTKWAVTPRTHGADAQEKDSPKKRLQGKKTSSLGIPYSSTSIRGEVKKAFDDVDPNLPGLKPLKDLKQKWEKYLWVLEVGRQKGVEVLTNAEIAFVLLEKFSLGVTEKQVNNLTFKVEDGYVQKREADGKRAWRILQPGIDFVSGSNNDQK